jgi:hypothetical protein
MRSARVDLLVSSPKDVTFQRSGRSVVLRGTDAPQREFGAGLGD